jgi:hypothetical protein
LSVPNRFTERAQRVILIAQEEGKRLKHNHVDTEHLLLGLIALGEGVAAQVLANLRVDSRHMRREIEKIVGTGTNVMLLGEISFTPGAKRVLEYAVEEEQQMGHSYVGTEHILLGLIREGDGVAARVLAALGLRHDLVRKEILELLGETPLTIPEERASRVETPPAIAAFLMNPVFSVLLNPHVTGLFSAHRPTRDDLQRNVLLILVEEGTDIVSLSSEFEKMIGGFRLLNIGYKFPGKRPLMWNDGKWQEDPTVDETITF